MLKKDKKDQKDQLSINLKLTPNLANQLIFLLDIATKAGGLEVAESALLITKMIQQASQQNGLSDVERNKA